MGPSLHCCGFFSRLYFMDTYPKWVMKLFIYFIHYKYFDFYFIALQLSKKVFSHLCDIVDDNGRAYDKRMQRMAKMVILDGE